MAARGSGDATRRSVLEAAAELVAQDGAAKLTLDAVAERVGLSKGGILHHFATKDSLIAAMVTYETVTEVQETMPLGLLLRGLRIELKGLIEETNAELTISELDGKAEVSRSLLQVLRELVVNSCRFRRPGMVPRIRVDAISLGVRSVEIRVADNGSGVAEEYRDAIFEPFRRMHSRSEYPGFGLGLAVCRRIVEVNGGSIAASASEEGGLCIRVVLPTE